jgi:voltage-gated potassium channel
MTIGKWNYTRIFMNPIYRKRVAELLETGRPDDPVIRLIHWLLTLLIGLNVMAVILESVAELEVRYYTLFLLFERASVAIFTLEYGLRGYGRIRICRERQLNAHYADVCVI